MAANPQPDPFRVVSADFESLGDRSAIVDLLASYADTPAGGSAGLAPDARERLASDLAGRPTAVVLLAKRGDEPVGLAIAFEGYSTFAAKPLLNLHDLVVAPNWRGRGVGGRLLDAIEEVANERGCGWLTLEVVGSNTGAQQLYRRHGFVGGESISPRSATMFFKKRLTETV